MGTEPGFVHEDYGSCNGSGATEQARSRRPSVSWIWLVGTQLEIALVLVLLPSTPPGAFKEGLGGREGGHSPPLGASGYPTRRGGRPPLQQLPSSSATQRAPAAAGPLLESSPSGWNSDISDIPQADENLFIPGTMFLALVRRARHHARVGLALGQPPSARLTSVYAVSQRDFSFEFRLRDYFFLGRPLSKDDSHIRTSVKG